MERQLSAMRHKMLLVGLDLADPELAVRSWDEEYSLSSEQRCSDDKESSSSQERTANSGSAKFKPTSRPFTAACSQLHKRLRC